MKPFVFERLPDRADAAVHHVRRREDIAAGLCLVQRLAHQHLDGAVVVDLAVDEEPVMAVAGIGVERHVADHPDIADARLDGAHRAADEVVRVESLARLFVAKRGIGVGEERDRRQFELGRRSRRP